MIKFGDAKGDNKGNDIFNENIEELEADMLQQVYQQPMHACTSVCSP